MVSNNVAQEVSRSLVGGGRRMAAQSASQADRAATAVSKMAGDTRIAARVDAQAASVLDGVQNAWNNLKTASGQVRLWEKKGYATRDQSADFAWAKPNHLRVDALGTTAVYNGGDTIQARMFFFTQSVSLDSPLATSLRGYRVNQTDLRSLFTALLDPQTTVRYAGTATVDNKAAHLLELGNVDRMLPGIQKATVAIDQKTSMPLRFEGSDGQEVVYRSELTGLKVNPKLASGTFEV